MGEVGLQLRNLLVKGGGDDVEEEVVVEWLGCGLDWAWGGLGLAAQACHREADGVGELGGGGE